MGAIAAAAVLAGVFVQFDGAPRAASSGLAGEAMMRVLNDEHVEMAGYLKQEAAARSQADVVAARDLEKMKLAAQEEAHASSLRLAQIVTPAREEKPKASIVRVVAKAEPVRTTTGSAVAGEPMQLLAMTETQPRQTPQQGLVRGKLHQLASTVERIPSWFNAAAGWVVDAVPVPRMPSLPQLPMRHFRV